MSPNCGQLGTSWILGAVGIALMGRFGNAGFILALPLMWIVQRVRLEHDREWGERCKQNPLCMGFVAVYYLLLLAVVVRMVVGHRDPTAVVGFAGSIVVFMLPFIIGMAVADFRICAARRRELAGG